MPDSNHPTTHQEVFDLLDAYVFGTLSKSEQQAVESHLNAGCSECEQALVELGELSVQMARALPQRTPPDRLKKAILANLTHHATTVDVRRHRPWIAWTIACVTTAAALILGLALNASLKENTKLRSALQEAEDVTSLLESPAMQYLGLTGVAPNEQAFGKVVLDPEQRAAVVYMYKLPQTPEGMTYQLWIMREGKPTSVGMFTVAEDGSAKLTLDTMPDESHPTFMVTIEPAGGQPAPTGMMYLTSPSVN